MTSSGSTPTGRRRRSTARRTPTTATSRLYYPNPRWKPSWGGALHFFDDDGATVHAVDYKPNRAVFFPADLVHAAEAPSAEFPGLRVSLAYKLKLRE